MDQFAFFESAVPLLESMTDGELAVVVAEYARFLASRMGNEAPPTDTPPPLAVELAWRCHLLRPLAYRRACAGRVVPHHPLPLDAYEYEKPLDSDADARSDSNSSSDSADLGVDLGVDLVAALRRQQAFMRHALEVLRPEFSSDEQAAAAVHEYVEFLSAMRETPVIVPTLATDLVWHVHMLFPVRYATECLMLAGHEVDHDDEMETDGLPVERA